MSNDKAVEKKWTEWWAMQKSLVSYNIETDSDILSFLLRVKCHRKGELDPFIFRIVSIRSSMYINSSIICKGWYVHYEWNKYFYTFSWSICLNAIQMYILLQSRVFTSSPLFCFNCQVVSLVNTIGTSLSYLQMSDQWSLTLLLNLLVIHGHK